MILLSIVQLQKGCSSKKNPLFRNEAQCNDEIILNIL